MARSAPSRLNRDRILTALRDASRKGDGHALAVAIDQMRALALSPRYWQKYLLLLKNPLARLVDLLVIKQGHRIAHQKGWKLRRPAGDDGGPEPSPPPKRRPRKRKRARARVGGAPASAVQPSLFD